MQFKWRQAQRSWASPSCRTLKTDANSCTKRRECLHFKITWAQISSWDARFIFSFHAGAMVWSLLPNKDTFRWCFDFRFLDPDGRSPKWTYGDTRLSKYIMGPVYICAFHGVAANITECVSNVKWAQNVFSYMPIIKCFDPVCWMLLGTPIVQLQSSKLCFSLYFTDIFTC